jgi:chromatin assembly factor 1 subunit B
MESTRCAVMKTGMDDIYWHRKGEVLATAGDDGNVLLWVPAENQTNTHNFEEGLEDKESWRVKTMCRSIGSEIYDLAWSPDGVYFITGSMDNVARIYNAQTGATHHPSRTRSTG